MFFVRRSSIQLLRYGLQLNRTPRLLFSVATNDLSHDQSGSSVKMDIDFLKEVARESADKGQRILLPVADSNAMNEILQPLIALTEDGKLLRSCCHL
jgi:hypothetical protein